MRMSTYIQASILPRNHGLLLNLLATPVTLGLGVARGSNVHTAAHQSHVRPPGLNTKLHERLGSGTRSITTQVSDG